MRTAYLLLCLLFAASYPTPAQSLSITARTIPITTNDSGQFTSLAALNPYWAKAQIIALGEQTHFDGATFDAKVQLVKYLHEQLGFNVLAFESGYYECTKAGALLDKERKPGVLKDAVFGVWDTKALQDLERYILQTFQTPRPLRITGFDFQFSGQLGAQYFLTDLEAALVQLGSGTLIRSPEWGTFKTAVARQIRYSNFYKKPAAADTTRIGAMSRKIITVLEDRRGTDPEAAGLAAFWQKALHNLAADTRHRYEGYNYRDSIMANNLLQLAGNEFAGEKIICWNATSHFMFNRPLVEDDYKTFVPMGHYLHQRLGDQLYTIGFTSFQGKSGSVVKYKLKAPPPNSIEAALGSLSIAYGFLDFSNDTLTNGSAASESITTRMLGNKFVRMPLAKVVSGLFYIRDAYPPR